MANGDITGVTVLSNGWQIQVTMSGTNPAGTTGAYALTPDATPAVSLTVSSPGFDSTGTATTVSRTVYATKWLRQPTPNDTLPTESSAGGSTTVTLVLSDFIHNTDTATFTCSAGWYSSNVNNTATTALAVTNNSTLAHFKPILAWVTEPYLVMTDSASFSVEATAFHCRPQSGRQVAAIKFTLTDGVSSFAQTVSSMTQSTRITGGNAVAVYKATFSAGCLLTGIGGSSIFTAPTTIRCDAVAYPFVGDQTCASNSGQDGVAITYTDRNPNLKSLPVVYDGATAKHTPVYAWVQSGGTASGSGQVRTSSADPGTANANNYSSILKAAQGIAAYNNTNRSHNDVSGGFIYVRAGTWNGFDPTGVSDLTAVTPGLTWLTVSAAPTASNTTVVLSPTTGGYLICDRVKFLNMGFTQADATFSGYNAVARGGDANSTSPIAYETCFDGCRHTTSASGYPMFWQIGLRHHYNDTVIETAGDSYLGLPFSTYRNCAVWLGCTITGPGGSANNFWAYKVLGNTMTGHNMSLATSSATSPNWVQPTGVVIAFNKITATVPWDQNAAQDMRAHMADVQNVYEKITVDGNWCHRMLADGDLTETFSNYVMQYVTIAGGRMNFMYNSTGTTALAKQASRKWVVIDPMASQGFNIKRDTFVDPVNGLQAGRIGNWDISHSVCSEGNIVNQSAEPTSTPSSTSWLGEYWGLTGSTVANNVGYGKSASFQSNKSASGTNAGSGDYRLSGGVSSVAYGRVRSGFAGLPFDLAGSTRRNDGTGAAGAFEIPVADASTVPFWPTITDYIFRKTEIIGT